MEVRSPKIPVPEVVDLLLCIHWEQHQPEFEGDPFELLAEGGAHIFLEVGVGNLRDLFDWRRVPFVAVESVVHVVAVDAEGAVGLILVYHSNFN